MVLGIPEPSNATNLDFHAGRRQLRVVDPFPLFISVECMDSCRFK